MFNIKLIAVGKLKEAYLRNLEEKYKKIICNKHRLSIVEVPDESIPKNKGKAMNTLIKKREGSKILENISGSDYVIMLAIDGKSMDSQKLSRLVEEGAKKKEGNIAFVIGGSLGLDEEVLKKADIKISFSEMTFPHQLMRIILLEQIACYL